MDTQEITLADTAKMMDSADYKERFKSEYYQLKIRRNKLRSILDAYYSGNFTLNCSYDLLHKQLVYMDGYMKVLEERAAIEKVFEGMPEGELSNENLS